MQLCFEHLFVDGTKIEANANKYSFVWKKSTNKYEQRALDKIEKLTETVRIKYGISEENEFEIYKTLKAKHTELTLIPLLKRMEKNGVVYQDVTCDAGYESEENYTFFENSETECYIKPQNYERSKTKKFKSNMALRENMKYDEFLDEYTCQNGKKLKAVYEGKRRFFRKL